MAPVTRFRRFNITESIFCFNMNETLYLGVVEVSRTINMAEWNSPNSIAGSKMIVKISCSI